MIGPTGITRSIALAQILRFENYGGFPDEHRRADQEELIRAFQQAARNELHAEEIGDYLIRTCTFCPKPAEVYTAVATLAPPEKPVDLQPQEWRGFEPKCRACQDTGWVVSSRGAMRCKCVSAKPEQEDATAR